MLFHTWQARQPFYVPPYDQAPWIRALIANSASVASLVTPDQLAALTRLADRVQAGEYRLDRASELTLRLLAYKGAFERGFWTEG